MTLSGALVVATLLAGVVTQAILQYASYRILRRHYQMVHDWIALQTHLPGERP